MTRFRIEDNKKIPFTAEEEKIRDAEEKEWNDGEAERKLNYVRQERNELLAQTDWMSLPDAPTMSDAWKTYRQELRDITKTYKTLDEVKWPNKPS